MKLIINKKVPFPQADDFKKIISIANFINSKLENEHLEAIREHTKLSFNNFSTRQVNYYLSALIYLGWIDRKMNNGTPIYCLTYEGKFLIDPLTSKEKIGQVIFAKLNLWHILDSIINRGKDFAAEELMMLEKLSLVTAKRRIQTLKSWINYFNISNLETIHDYTKEIEIDNQIDTEYERELFLNLHHDVRLQGFNIETKSFRRLGQEQLRKQVLSLYDNKCLITNISHITILSASHILSWKESDSYQKVNPYNCLILTKNLHSAFDNYEFTISCKGQIILSKYILPKIYEQLQIKDGQSVSINLHENTQVFLKYHNDNFYKKEEGRKNK